MTRPLALRLVALFLPAAILLATAPAQAPQAQFDAPMVVLPEEAPPFQKLFDMDGDGDMDAVGTRVYSNGTAYEVWVWRNDRGHYVPAVQWQGNMTPPRNGPFRNMRVAIGDIDGDGRIDFAVAEGVMVETWRNNGNDTFTRSVFTIANHIADLGCADFNGDGRADLAWFMDANSTLEVQITNGARLSTVLPAGLNRSSRIETLDIDGDARPEVGVWNQIVNRIHLVDVQAAALVPQATLVAPAPTNGYSHWTHGDIDGDGDTDVVAFQYWPAPALVHTFRRTGPAAWTLENGYPGGPAEFLADVDGDGDLDGVCCGGGSGTPPTWPRLDFGSLFEIAINDGTGRMAVAFTMPGKGSSRLAGVTDVDGDGDLDLVAGACVHYSRGPLRGPVCGTNDFYWPTVSTPALLRDGDRDGDPDLGMGMVTGTQGAAVNQGDGTFVMLPASSPNAGLPAGFTRELWQFDGDFDGDGALDSIVPLIASNGVFHHMGLFRNNGSGHWLYAGPVAPTGVPIGWRIPWASGQNSALVADVDGDGDMDLIARADTSYESPARTELWLNQGNATFVAGATYQGDRFEVVADLDGDGIADALTATAWPGNLGYRLGTGVPAAPFGPRQAMPASLPIQLGPAMVRVVDANDDGRPDVLTFGHHNTPLARAPKIWCNTTTTPGNLTFGPSLDLPLVAYGSGEVGVVDVDGDGMTDLLVTQPEGRGATLRVWHRTGGTGVPLTIGHYQPGPEQTFWNGFPGDADGDGDIDLIGNHVLRNVRFHGPEAGRRIQYGVPTAGEAGIAPLLGAIGPLRVGMVKRLQLVGVTGPAPALLAIGVGRAALPDFPIAGVTCNIAPGHLVTLLVAIQEHGNGRANGRLELPVYLPSSLRGLEFFEQAFVLDPAGPGGVSASNGLAVLIGG